MIFVAPMCESCLTRMFQSLVLPIMLIGGMSTMRSKHMPIVYFYGSCSRGSVKS